MSAKITKKFNVTPTLEQGEGGVFEVYKNDTLVYSKKQTGKFPKDDDILKKLETN